MASTLFVRLMSVLTEENINVAEELKIFGLSRREIDIRSENIVYETFYQFVEHVLSRHRVPALGARFGDRVALGDWGMLGTGILSCESVWDAYLRFGDIQKYSGDLIKLDFSESTLGGVAEINKFDRPTLVPFYNEFVMANTWTNFIRPIQTLTTEVKLDRLQFTFPADEDSLVYYQQIFACPIEFGAARDALHFPRQLLHQKNPFRNKGAMQYCLEQIQSLDRKMGGTGSHTQRVEELLLCSIDESLPTIDEAAKKLALSSRSLRRRLETEGTNYSAVVQKVRMDMATYFLTRTHRPVEHIADALKYSSITSFSRAFKHFVGVSPRDYRANN